MAIAEDTAAHASISEQVTFIFDKAVYDSAMSATTSLPLLRLPAAIEAALIAGARDAERLCKPLQLGQKQGGECWHRCLTRRVTGVPAIRPGAYRVGLTCGRPYGVQRGPGYGRWDLRLHGLRYQIGGFGHKDPSKMRGRP